MDIDILKEWEPFGEYPEPCYLLYEGDPAVFVPGLNDVPIKIKGEEIGRAGTEKS